MRTEPIRIKTDSDVSAKIIVGMLISLGYKIAGGGTTKEYTDSHSEIWVNCRHGRHDHTGSFLFGMPTGYGATECDWLHTFDASKNMGEITAFFAGQAAVSVTKPAKPHYTTHPRVAVYIGTDRLLGQMVVELMTGAGWVDYGNPVIPVAVCRYRDDACLFAGSDGPTILCTSSSRAKIDGDTLLDAKEHFSDVVEFFTPLKVTVPIIKVKNTSGQEYTAEFYKDYVAFGCAKIYNSEFERFASPKVGNAEYKYATSVTIGRGVFPIEVIDAIVSHPHFKRGN